MIKIIPAIDIIDGKCVRLTKGDYSTQKIYGDDPEEIARRFQDIGCTRLHVVDLDGAKASHIVNYNSLERICSINGITVDFGGGIKSDEDVRIALESGASMVTGGSVAVNNQDLFISWVQRYGSDVIILGADSKNGRISANGWLEDSDLEIIPFVRDYISKGVKKVISTDISQDGTLKGPSVVLYKEMLRQIPDMHLVASGGIGQMSDIFALDDMGIPEVIVGKAIYEGRIKMHDLERFNLAK